jgi:hypothetical protein
MLQNKKWQHIILSKYHALLKKEEKAKPYLKPPDEMPYNNQYNGYEVYYSEFQLLEFCY